MYHLVLTIFKYSVQVSQKHDNFYKRLGGVFQDLREWRETVKQCLLYKWEFIKSDQKSQKEKVKTGPEKSLIIGKKTKEKSPELVNNMFSPYILCSSPVIYFPS